jgi:hypothetical protein
MSPKRASNCIRECKELILSQWMDSVRRDPRISSDNSLKDSGLRDHVPQLLEEICDHLQSGASPEVGSVREGPVHVYTRYCQGFRARDLVSEISLLRLILLDHIIKCPTHGSTSIDPGYLDSCRIINLYIDQELRYAFSIYTEVSDPRPDDLSKLVN